jgi:hypothetical protein
MKMEKIKKEALSYSIIPDSKVGIISKVEGDKKQYYLKIQIGPYSTNILLNRVFEDPTEAQLVLEQIKENKQVF